VNDVFALQDEISRAIVNALQGTLGMAASTPLVPRATASPEAHDFYLQGRFFFGGRTDATRLRKSVDYFERAVHADPSYAAAYSGLSDAHSVLAIWNYEPDGFDRAKVAARQALALDSTLAEAHTSLGIISLLHDWDLPAAERELTRAIALDPQYAPAHLFKQLYFTVVGKPADAIREIEQARQLDPLSVILSTRVGSSLYNAHRYDEAAAQLRHTLELDSTNALARAELARAYLQLHRCSDAIAAARLVPPGLQMTEGAVRGYAYALCGDRGEAVRVLNDLEHGISGGTARAVEIAQVHVGLGQRDSAIAWLEQGYQDRDPYMILLSVEPLYQPLRSDPRFERLVKLVGLRP
jgi:tetratricopeptide (TPR) repeat protein